MKKSVLISGLIIYICTMFTGCLIFDLTTNLTDRPDRPESDSPPDFWTEVPEAQLSLPDWIVRYPGQAYTVATGTAVSWELLAKSFDEDSRRPETSTRNA